MGLRVAFTPELGNSWGLNFLEKNFILGLTRIL